MKQFRSFFSYLESKKCVEVDWKWSKYVTPGDQNNANSLQIHFNILLFLDVSTIFLREENRLENRSKSFASEEYHFSKSSLFFLAEYAKRETEAFVKIRQATSGKKIYFLGGWMGRYIIWNLSIYLGNLFHLIHHRPFNPIFLFSTRKEEEKTDCWCPYSSKLCVRRYLEEKKVCERRKHWSINGFIFLVV